MELREKLIELRKAKGWTQDELARELGISRQAVSKWERGVIAPATVNLIALGRLYGVPLDELVNGELPPEERPAAAVAVEERPEAAAPRGKSGPLKIAGAAVLALCILLTGVALGIIVNSTVPKAPEESKNGPTIIWQDDLQGEDIDWTEVQDWTDGTTTIIP